ncbi:thioredoxin family protein [Profundibacter sp.]
MKHFKVLGSGCKNCENTAEMIEQAAKAAGVDVEVEKVTDMGAIMGYGVMSTPGVVLDEKLVHAGGIPAPEKVQEWVQG